MTTEAAPPPTDPHGTGAGSPPAPVWARPWVPLLLVALLAGATAWAIAATVRGGAVDVEDPQALAAQACEHLAAVDAVGPLPDLTPGSDPRGVELASRLWAASALADVAAARDAEFTPISEAIREPYVQLAQNLETGEQYEAAMDAATDACSGSGF